MSNPYDRPCWSGPCTDRGMATPGFCKCKADAELIRDEYERGKMHGADDRRSIEQHNREQAREIDRLKREIGEWKREAYSRSTSTSVASVALPNPHKL